MKQNKEAMIENYGIEKYHETLDRIDDEDKIVLTQASDFAKIFTTRRRTSSKK